METGLDGKTVVVTGASGGIGQEVARQFAREKAGVVAHFHRGEDRARALLNELETERKMICGADLTSESEVRSLFDAAESSLGTPEVLVANAGFWPPDDQPIHELSLERWHQTLAVDLTSVFLCVREFLRRAVERQVGTPAIVMVGSTAGHFGEAGHGDYAASKGGLMHGMLKSLKNEIARVAPRGRINAVCPGWTLTPMARKLATDETAMKRALQTIALRKFGKPADMAAAIVFLSSSHLAGHITGQTLFVDGGMEGRVLYREEEIDISQAI